MAPRKPLFMTTEGFSEEMATTDSMTLGGLTMSGGNIAMGTNKITGLADGTDDNDAVNKSQLDQAIITGGTVKEVLLTSSQLDNTDGIYAAMMTYFANNPSSGNTITITDGTTTRTYGAGTGGDVQYTIGGTPWDTMQNFATAVAGDGSASWTAEATQEFDEINSNGVVIILEDATGAGLSTLRMYGTFGTQADLQVVEYSDGTTADLDYANNTSSTAVTTDPAGGRAGFQRQQSSLVDGEIHYTRLTDVTYAWDDSDNIWQTMSGSGAIPDATSASGGGVKGKVTFDSDKGLVVSSGVAEVDIDEVTLDFSGGAIEVTGVPSLFEIAGTPVGATVTAANLDTVTDGSNADALHVHTGTGVSLSHSDLSGVTSDQHHPQLHTIASHSDTTATGAELETLTDGSNADALHSHTASAATEAPKVENTLTTATDATANGDPVYINGDETIGKSLANDDAKSRVIGVIRTGAGAAGATPEVVSLGICAGILTGATPGVPYYLQTAGGIGTSLPGGGNRVIQVGWAYSDTDLWVELKDYGKKAA